MTEGDVVRLRGEAFGIYANEIAFGVECSESIATDVEPGMLACCLQELSQLPYYILLPIYFMCAAYRGRDFNFTVGTKLHFREFGSTRSYSPDQVVIPIINDDIVEPRESFICTLQKPIVHSVQTIFPSQVTIEIHDDDGEHMHVLGLL